MDSLPDTLLGPDSKVMVTGFPGREIVGHHAPSCTRANDIKDAVNNRSFGMFSWSSPELWVGFWEKLYENFPL